MIVEPTLPARLQVYARNFRLLQESKEEISIDMALRVTEPEEMENVEIVDATSDIDNLDSERKCRPRSSSWDFSKDLSHFD
jgi:hypothetical protein